MNILITRPLIENEDLMQKMFSSGHKIIHLPTLKILPADMKPVNMDKYDALILLALMQYEILK